jgi:hypothetical protein
MNERIKELAEQAGYKPLPGFDFANSLEETYLKKFAELIVRECTGIYSKIDNGNQHFGTDDYLEALHKTFFGVES